MWTLPPCRAEPLRLGAVALSTSALHKLTAFGGLLPFPSANSGSAPEERSLFPGKGRRVSYEAAQGGPGNPSAVSESCRRCGGVRRDIWVQTSMAHSAHSQHHPRCSSLPFARTQRKSGASGGDCFRRKESTVVSGYLEGIWPKSPSRCLKPQTV